VGVQCMWNEVAYIHMIWQQKTYYQYGNKVTTYSLLIKNSCDATWKYI